MSAGAWSYVQAYREAGARQGAEEEARAKEAIGKLRELAKRLRSEHGARRVGYFGSLATGRFRDDSDVDVYVDRVRCGGYFRAVDTLCAALGRSVDLVELERAPESLRSCIADTGVDLDA